jgi:hypothetical protein
MAKKKRAAAGDRRVPPEVPIGSELAAPRTVEGRNGGTLHPHQPGSNGGVRRGPDLQPRNLVKATILKAMSDEGCVVTDRKNWRKAKRQPHALVHNAARGMQRVFENMAEGDKDAYGPGLRALQMMHDVMQSAKDEGRGPSGPIAPRFTRPASPPPAAPTAAAGPEPLFVDRDGREYVDGDA